MTDIFRCTTQFARGTQPSCRQPNLPNTDCSFPFPHQTAVRRWGLLLTLAITIGVVTHATAVTVLAQANQGANQGASEGAKTAQQETTSPEELAAQNIAQIALRAQNAEDYALAAQQWEKLISEHPQSALLAKAHYNAGVCYVQLQNFPAATKQMSAAIPKFTDDDIQLQPQAYLFLGFSQLRSGQELIRKPDPAAQKEANVLLTTATQNFTDLLQKFPNFVDADQAAFFQGNAFENLQRLKDADKAYAAMMKFEKQTFKLEGLYAIANVNEQLGKQDVALDYYQQFRSAAGVEHPLTPEVNLRTGKTLISLANAAVNAGDAAGAVANFKQAEKLLGELAATMATAKAPEQLAFADEAQFQQAYCQTQLGEFETAARTYELVAARTESPFRPQALVYAGRSYNQAGKRNEAISNLQAALATESPFALEAAVTLSNLLIKQGDFQAAFDLTDQWIKKSPDNKMLPLLMADRADAAYQIEAKKVESPALFLATAEKFPEHSVAPSSLYNAAYAQLELNQLDAAIATAEKFETKYPSSDFLPDTLEVKADALLLKDDAASAETQFDRLIEKFPKHEKINRWLLRNSVAKFIQKKFQPTIDLLRPKLASFSDPKQIAEAQHWVGASQFSLGQFPEAVASLEKSVAATTDWRSSDDTLLTLARAQFKTEKIADGQSTIQTMIATFPKSPLLGSAYYHLGDQAFAAKDYDTAFKNFQTVIDKYPQSEWVPAALYSAAWSKLEQQKFDESEVLFSKLMTDFPKHELAEKAKIGRGATRRKTGNTSESIADLSAFLETSPTGPTKFNAMYELGLAQVEAKAWPDAVKTFETLIAEDSAAPRIDQYHYELAWALQEVDQSAASLKQFATIAEKTPNSPLAAEANFHLGSAAYAVDDFPTAIAAYEKCVAYEGAGTVREKAFYKLGWAYYKQDQYEAAQNQFAKQVELFPTGELAADGKFMVAESQFRQKKHDAALAAYIVAKPAVDEAQNIDPKIKLLTLLHGAQSANQVKKFDEALKLATPLTATEVDPSFQTDAWLEIGSANEGLGKSDLAKEAWEKAKLSNSTTGARAACMIGDLLFKQKKFDAAITEFKLVNYRFGGPDQPAEIKPWVAYALYSAARCSYVQVADAPADQKPAMIKEAIKQFETLIENYPDDRLTPGAKEQLEKLKQI